MGVQPAINALESLRKLIDALPDECRDFSGRTDQLKLMAAQAAKLAAIREKFQNGRTPGAGEQATISMDLNGFQHRSVKQSDKSPHQPGNPSAVEIAAKFGLLMEVLFGVLLGAARLQAD